MTPYHSPNNTETWGGASVCVGVSFCEPHVFRCERSREHGKANVGSIHSKIFYIIGLRWWSSLPLQLFYPDSSLLLVCWPYSLLSRMKWTAWTLAAVVATSSTCFTSAFTPRPTSTPSTHHHSMSASTTATLSFAGRLPHGTSTSLKMAPKGDGLTVGIVGATGAVGKEIQQCLVKREFPVGRLRIFGSERSAGKVVPGIGGQDVTVELFDVKAARECDVVFLAVSGDFASEHAKAITEGEDGAVCIDNSVRIVLVV